MVDIYVDMHWSDSKDFLPTNMLHVLLSKKRGKQGEATFRADERSLKGSSWPLAVGKNMESACSSWQFPCDWINLASSTKKVYNHNLRCLRIKREV